MKNFLKKRWDKHYQKNNKNRYWHLIIDSLFSVMILTLILVNTYLSASNAGVVLGTQNDDNFNDTENNQNSNQNTNTNSTATDNQIDNEEPITIKSTDIKLQSLARYYTAEGEQLGIGPLPPTVGIITKYWIFISLDGFMHNLENTLVSAKLPDNIFLTGKSSVTLGDNMSYDVNSREIQWSLGNIFTTDKQETIGLAFEVQLIPSESQMGSVAQLLTDIKVSALDSITQKNITKTNPVITTNLINDKIANSEGIIIIQ